MLYCTQTFSNPTNLNARIFQGLSMRDYNRPSRFYLHCSVILWTGKMDVNIKVMSTDGSCGKSTHINAISKIDC